MCIQQFKNTLLPKHGVHPRSYLSILFLQKCFTGNRISLLPYPRWKPAAIDGIDSEAIRKQYGGARRIVYHPIFITIE